MNSKSKLRKAMVIILWENQVLLLKRPQEKGDFWQPVTGHIEKDEDFEEGALREAQEETGFKFSDKLHYLGIHFQFNGKWGEAEEKAYSLRLPSTPLPPTPILDSSEHEAFEWFSPTEAIQRVPYPETKEAIFRATFRPSPFVLTREGNWYQDGEQITHARSVDLLHQSLEKRGEATFVIHVGGVEVPATIEDAPIFIKSVDLQSEKVLLISGVLSELDPSTIYVGNENILYCKIQGMKAKFTRSAYYALTHRIEEIPSSDGSMKYFLHWRGRKHEITIPK